MPASDQGSLKERYTLVPRTLVFLTCDDQVLLLKGAPHKRLWAGRYNGIGGHVERGEDVLSAAHRELLEETGLKVPGLWLCGIVTIDTGQAVGIGLYVFRGEWSQAELIPSKEGTPEWIAIKDLTRQPLVEDLPILLSRVLEIQRRDPPFFAHYTYDETGKLHITFMAEEKWVN